MYGVLVKISLLENDDPAVLLGVRIVKFLVGDSNTCYASCAASVENISCLGEGGSSRENIVKYDHVSSFYHVRFFDCKCSTDIFKSGLF